MDRGASTLGSVPGTTRGSSGDGGWTGMEKKKKSVKGEILDNYNILREILKASFSF